MNATALLSERATGIDVSGIRRVFELAASLKDPINLSIGQPDFGVPEVMRRAAAEAIEAGKNGYTLTQGDELLRARTAEHLRSDLGWDVHPHLPPIDDPDRPSLMITSGPSGALLLAAMALLDPGDEVVIPDPYFVVYPNLAKMLSAKAVLGAPSPAFRISPRAGGVAPPPPPGSPRRSAVRARGPPAGPTGSAAARRRPRRCPP